MLSDYKTSNQCITSWTTISS